MSSFSLTNVSRGEGVVHGQLDRQTSQCGMSRSLWWQGRTKKECECIHFLHTSFEARQPRDCPLPPPPEQCEKGHEATPYVPRNIYPHKGAANDLASVAKPCFVLRNSFFLHQKQRRRNLTTKGLFSSTHPHRWNSDEIYSTPQSCTEHAEVRTRVHPCTAPTPQSAAVSHHPAEQRPKYSASVKVEKEHNYHPPLSLSQVLGTMQFNAFQKGYAVAHIFALQLQLNQTPVVHGVIGTSSPFTWNCSGVPV